MKLLRYTILLALTLSGVVVSYAATINVVPPSGNIILPGINANAPGDAIGSIIAWFIGLTAVLTILAVTWAGIQMVLAIGEEEKFKKARYTMIYAFTGLIIAGLAYAIVTFITNINLNSFL